MDYPDVMNSLNILTTDRTSNWALEIADQGDGTIAITGISVGTYLSQETDLFVGLSYTLLLMKK